MHDVSSSAVIIKNIYQHPDKNYEQQLDGYITELCDMGHNWLDEVFANSLNQIISNVPKRQALISSNESRAEPDQRLIKNDFRVKPKPGEILQETPCEFFVSAFRLPLTLGSKEGNKFMRSLIDSPN